jgi:hypothetical protein
MIKYQAYKLLYNQPQTLGSFAFSTEEEAIDYAKSRDLKLNEILIKEVFLEEEFTKEFYEY